MSSWDPCRAGPWPDDAAGHVRFMTLLGSAEEARHALLLIASLRAFGGHLSRSSVWVFYRPELHVLVQQMLRAGRFYDPPSDLAGVEFVPLRPSVGSGSNGGPALPEQNGNPDGAPFYLFGDKVQACAQAEERAGSDIRCLIWLNPECLIVSPPLLFDLEPSFDAAFRPVHHQNVGSPAQEALDEFWKGVYAAAGLDDGPFTVESFADAQTLRPYFNTHCFSIDPSKGLCRAWLECFTALAADDRFQAGACRDHLHRVFLHQAVLSTLAAKTLGKARIRILPPEYSYPLHMHHKIPPGRRAHRLNDLVCPVYEDDFHYPGTLNGLPADEPLASWLMQRTVNRDEQSVGGPADPIGGQ